jgi:prepilin-type processing-associated H-X9-DG protein/prepilin-type N-terminal cleavage/methylation domain-containing protein
MRARNNGGFSYIELLVVMAIVLILYALWYGPGSKGVQEKRKAECSKNLQQVWMALQVYAADHDGAYPFVAGAKTAEEPLDLLVPKYSSDTDAFICPGSGDSRLPSAESIASRRISYAYCMGTRPDMGEAQILMADRLINTTLKHKGDQVFSADGKAPGRNHRSYGGNILFCDGHVESWGVAAERPFTFPAHTLLLNPRE